MTSRLIAGVPCTALSPSLYRIDAVTAREGHPLAETFILFNGQFWTLEWTLTTGARQVCSLAFSRPEGVMNYILDISVRREQA